MHVRGKMNKDIEYIALEWQAKVEITREFSI
jgi:hypothetical protein